jgi:hypothetical protein
VLWACRRARPRPSLCPQRLRSGPQPGEKRATPRLTLFQAGRERDLLSMGCPSARELPPRPRVVPVPMDRRTPWDRDANPIPRMAGNPTHRSSVKACARLTLSRASDPRSHWSAYLGTGVPHFMFFWRTAREPASAARALRDRQLQPVLAGWVGIRSARSRGQHLSDDNPA